jgi:hypothetical protein
MVRLYKTKKPIPNIPSDSGISDQNKILNLALWQRLDHFAVHDPKSITLP